MSDNRNYCWDNEQIILRPEYSFILNWISAGVKVIDLGCGNGSLLRILREKKNIEAFGIEISDTGVDVCKKNGINVKQGRIDVELKDISDNYFDFAICNVTIQMLIYPEITLREMKRISKYQIVSFPNFAFLFQRLELIFNGRMPRKLLYGYDWYSTGHLHQLSIKDFKNTAVMLGMKIKNAVYLIGRHKMPVCIMPNLFATEAILLIQKESK